MPYSLQNELKDLLYITGIVASTLVTFLGTRHKLKEYIRDKNDVLKDQIQDLKMQLREQKSKDDTNATTATLQAFVRTSP